MTLPTYMLAIRPQNTSGCSDTSCGPGLMPWIIIAESRIAVAGIAGMPSTSSGTIALPVVALFAVSGPATPAIAPWPNSSGCFEKRFSTA